MLRASRRGAAAPASASCPRVLRSAATGTHQTSGPRKTADFFRGESSSQNRSISCSRCVSVAQVTASDERCCEEWGPEYPPASTMTALNLLIVGRTDEAVREPLENSALRNSKAMFSERRNQ